MNKLLSIQSELKAPKSQFNSFGKYYYRNCEDILEALKPLLVQYEVTLVLSDEIIAVGTRIYVKATAQLFEGDKKSHNATAYARESEDKKGMDSAQVTGAAGSYARKYALNGLFLIDDTKDADSSNDHGKGEEAHKPAYRAEIPPKPSENPATGKPDPMTAGAMAPKQGLSAAGLITKIFPPNAGGYVGVCLDGYEVDGRDMRFATKSAEDIAIIEEAEKNGSKVHLDYNTTQSGRFTNYNVTKATEIKNEVPF